MLFALCVLQITFLMFSASSPQQHYLSVRLLSILLLTSPVTKLHQGVGEQKSQFLGLVESRKCPQRHKIIPKEMETLGAMAMFPVSIIGEGWYRWNMPYMWTRECWVSLSLPLPCAVLQTNATTLPRLLSIQRSRFYTVLRVQGRRGC